MNEMGDYKKHLSVDDLLDDLEQAVRDGEWRTIKSIRDEILAKFTERPISITTNAASVAAWVPALGTATAVPFYGQCLNCGVPFPPPSAAGHICRFSRTLP